MRDEQKQTPGGHEEHLSVCVSEGMFLINTSLSYPIAWWSECNEQQTTPQNRDDPGSGGSLDFLIGFVGVHLSKLITWKQAKNITLLNLNCLVGRLHLHCIPVKTKSHNMWKVTVSSFHT